MEGEPRQKFHPFFRIFLYTLWRKNLIQSFLAFWSFFIYHVTKQSFEFDVIGLIYESINYISHLFFIYFLLISLRKYFFFRVLCLFWSLFVKLWSTEFWMNGQRLDVSDVLPANKHTLELLMLLLWPQFSFKYLVWGNIFQIY